MIETAFGPSMVFENATEAWEFWYNELVQQNKGDESRDGTIRGELMNVLCTITDPTRGIVNSKIRKMPMRYAVGELLWYLSGSNSVKDIAHYSKVWERLSDDGETVNSAYGHRIFDRFGFDQWEWVKQELRDNPASRRAVIHIKDPSNTPTKDMPCTCLLQFFVRNGALHLTVYMRSNDIWMGFPYDVFSFTCMQVKMAFELGLDIGYYTHIAGSLHLYERDVPKEVDNPDGTEAK